jgi:ribosome maturation factor RimP
MYRDIPRDLLTAIEPVVGEHGCELVDLEMATGSSKSTVVRLTVDTLEGDGRVPVEVCARISREVGVQLDALAPGGALAGAYNLEVSSPGLDRLLAREKDFASARGQEVKLTTRRPVGGRRRFTGRLLEFREADGVLVLTVDGQDHEIPFHEIERANSIYQFSRDDFASEKLETGEESQKSSGRTK